MTYRRRLVSVIRKRPKWLGKPVSSCSPSNTSSQCNDDRAPSPLDTPPVVPSGRPLPASSHSEWRRWFVVDPARLPDRPHLQQQADTRLQTGFETWYVDFGRRSPGLMDTAAACRWRRIPLVATCHNDLPSSMQPRQCMHAARRQQALADVGSPRQVDHPAVGPPCRRPGPSARRTAPVRSAASPWS